MYLFVLVVELKNWLIFPVLSVVNIKQKAKNKTMKAKKIIDPRHLKRQKAIKALFAHSFKKEAKTNNNKPPSFLSKKVIRKLKTIDKIVIGAAPKWPIDKINRIDLAILRLAVWELYFNKKTPPKVAIDEAIELAKEYGAESSSSFVNGVLGTIYKNIENEPEKS
jgi:transcription antitermination protein NusB